MQRGHDLRRERQYVRAAGAFAAAVNRRPQDRDALLYHATALREAGFSGNAEQSYRALVAAHPADALGWRMFGVFLKNAQRYEEAVEPLARSLALEDDSETRNCLVISLCESGRLEDATREGLRNLALKDRQAVERFAQSPSAGRTLQGSPGPFDVKTPHRNIIAFALWGEDPVYVHGAIVNARIAPHIYYGWTPRFYCDATVPDDALVELRRAGAQVVMMEDPALQAIRPMWRFLASDDPEVDWFICRDADSRLNCQELLAVDDWLRSGQPFHVMRDHIYHMELMLAGMWGGAAHVLPNLRDWLLAMPEFHNNRFGDQAFLMHEIWPLIRDRLCTHDSFYRFHNGRDFPGAYRLPAPVHVGGAVKTMPDWRPATS